MSSYNYTTYFFQQQHYQLLPSILPLCLFAKHFQTHFFPKNFVSRLHECFYKHINNLVLHRNTFHFNHTTPNLLTNEMMLKVNVFGTRMTSWILYQYYMAPRLSHIMGVLFTCLNLISLMSCISHIVSLPHLLIAMYFASIVNNGMVGCLFEFD